MTSREINTLKLKFYSNVERLGRTQNGTNKQIKNTDICFQERNFMEYYIDGKSLINEIGMKFWNRQNSENFFDSKNSFLGSFDEDTDIIFISLMLKLESKESIRKFINCYISSEMSEERFRLIFKEIKEEEDKITLLYGCTCGDIYCGGIGAEIKKDENYYYWFFGEDKNTLSYKFDINEYENELTDFMKDKKDINNIYQYLVRIHYAITN